MFFGAAGPKLPLRQLEAPPNPQPKTTDALTWQGRPLLFFFSLFLLLMMTNMSRDALTNEEEMIGS